MMLRGEHAALSLRDVVGHYKVGTIVGSAELNDQRAVAEYLAAAGPGAVAHAKYISWSEWPGYRMAVKAGPYGTEQEAVDAAWAAAIEAGWTRPRWWQWWRWGERDRVVGA